MSSVGIFKGKEKNICQGDIFFPDESEINDVLNIDAKLPIRGFIVVSNSCDIKNESIDYLSIAPIIPLQYIIDLKIERKRIKKEAQNKVLSNKEIKEIKNKNIEVVMSYDKKLYFYLPKKESYNIKEDCIVLLEMILTYELNKIFKLIKKKRKCTLKSPWREKLGWSVGNLYNRVALEDFKEDDIETVVSNIITS